MIGATHKCLWRGDWNTSGRIMNACVCWMTLLKCLILHMLHLPHVVTHEFMNFFFFDNDINRLLKTWVFVHVCGVDWMYNFYQLHDVYGVYCGNSVIIYLLFLYVKQNNCISLETTTTDLCLKPTSKNYLSCTALKISKF